MRQDTWPSTRGVGGGEGKAADRNVSAPRSPSATLEGSNCSDRETALQLRFSWKPSYCLCILQKLREGSMLQNTDLLGMRHGQFPHRGVLRTFVPLAGRAAERGEGGGAVFREGLHCQGFGPLVLHRVS